MMLIWKDYRDYIEIQGTTPNFCPKNLGILVSGMGQLQGFFGTYISPLNKNLKLAIGKCIYITDIKTTFWDTAQYFHSKQLRKSFEKIFSLKFVKVGYKRPNSFFQKNIVTCSLVPALLNLQVQLSYF